MSLPKKNRDFVAAMPGTRANRFKKQGAGLNQAHVKN